MQLDEELPESLEELEKEIEELEKAEISPPSEIVKRKKEPRPPSEKKFSIASILLGLSILFGVFFVLLLILGGDPMLMIDVLTEIPRYPNVLTQAILEQSPPSSNGDTIVSALSEKISSEPYVLFMIVGFMPYLLSGIIAGIMNKDPGYGFIAGFVIWALSLITAIIAAYLGGSIDLASLLLNLVLSSYISAMFLAMFGALGGGARKR